MWLKHVNEGDQEEHQLLDVEKYYKIFSTER